MFHEVVFGDPRQSIVKAHDATRATGTSSDRGGNVVAPDSGTGQLIGLAGEMSINIVEGKHSYDFEYTLDEAS
jgi:hypothetical protein